MKRNTDIPIRSDDLDLLGKLGENLPPIPTTQTPIEFFDFGKYSALRGKPEQHQYFKAHIQQEGLTLKNLAGLYGIGITNNELQEVVGLMVQIIEREDKAAFDLFANGAQDIHDDLSAINGTCHPTTTKILRPLSAAISPYL